MIGGAYVQGKIFRKTNQVVLGVNWYLGLDWHWLDWLPKRGFLWFVFFGIFDVGCLCGLIGF